MLWPEKRDKDSLLGDKIPGLIDRTPAADLSARRQAATCPTSCSRLSSDRLPSKVFSDGGIEIGPIPTGTPIGLLANVNLLSEDSDLAQRRRATRRKVGGTGGEDRRGTWRSCPENATDAQAREVFKDLVDPLLEVSKCPDLIVNRGHLFGTTLPDADKRALIEFLKTF